jgi:hypothetical protein
MNLSILPQGEEVRDVMGNVLVLGMDPTRGTADFPRVSWRGRNRLEVRYDTALAVRHAVAEVAAVRITYLTASGDPISGEHP